MTLQICLRVITCFIGDGPCTDLTLINRKCSLKFSTIFEAGLSDDPHLIHSMFKATFQKEEPKILINRDFKKFTFTNFQYELISQLNSRNSHEYFTFEKSFIEVLDKLVPKKKKIIRGNQIPYFDKTLRSAVMKSSQLKKQSYEI